MLRFIDLSDEYWTDEGTPICAFLSTSDDCFVRNDSGSQTFSDLDDIQSIENLDVRNRCLRLLPNGFFNGKPPATIEEENICIELERVFKADFNPSDRTPDPRVLAIVRGLRTS